MDGPARNDTGAAAEAAAWLAAHWDPDLGLAEWRETLTRSGWGAPSWPADLWGRGLGPSDAAAVAAEFAAVGAVGAPIGSGMALAAPTLLAHAGADLARRLLHGILTGRDVWCQLFSEPGNGSDLAGLTTRAEQNGDEWVINGQKVWTTGAHHAAYGMLLARSNWDAPKHRGITYFALPMDQAGVEVRPLRQMNGRASFNEVFLTDARVPAANVVGDVNGGWAAALTTLAHERTLGANRLPQSVTSGTGRCARQAAAEAAEHLRTYEWYPQRAGRPELVVTRAAGADPVAVQAAVDVEIRRRAAEWTVARARAAAAAGRRPGPEGSLAKLLGTGLARRAAAAHTALSGPHAQLDGPDSADDGLVADIVVSVPAGSIAGGTDEIQRNILGERVLGLPREPSVDADVPFRQVRRNAP